VRRETGANPVILALAVGTVVVVLTTFVFTTLVEEPGTAVALVFILALSIALDLAWKQRRDRPSATDLAPEIA
jgi:hypothetical protein